MQFLNSIWSRKYIETFSHGSAFGINLRRFCYKVALGQRNYARSAERPLCLA
jgi:hypothetical protein